MAALAASRIPGGTGCGRLGLSSYSLFLWHEPLAHFLRTHGLTFPGAGGLAINIVVLLITSVAFSIFTYKLIERPALRFKARSRRPIAPNDDPRAARTSR